MQYCVMIESHEEADAQYAAVKEEKKKQNTWLFLDLVSEHMLSVFSLWSWRKKKG